MTPTYTNLTLTGNKIDAVVIGGRNLGRDVTLDSVGGLKGLPFILTGGANIPHGLTLTLQPGTIVKLNPSQAIDVHGTLRALGTAAQPITLTPSEANPAANRWARIMVYTDGTLNLDHADIGYSGHECRHRDPVVERPGAELDDPSQRHPRGSVGDGRHQPDLRVHHDRQQHEADAIGQDSIDMTPTYTHLTLTGNRTDAVVIGGRNLGRDVTLDSIGGLKGRPFILTGGANIPHGLTLTLQPGAIVKLNPSQAIDVHGTLTALGTVSQPITLTASATSPESGRWARIMVYTDGAANLDHTDIGYSGATNAAVEIQSSNVWIRNSAIHHSATRGLLVELNRSPVLSYNRIYANTAAGLDNATPATLVDARNHWWGHASGPYHPTLNPAGQGQTVSNGVLFSPWLGDYAWLGPDTPIFHGDVTLAWGARAASPGSLTVDVRAVGPGGEIALGAGLPADGAIIWRTASAPDGVYELRADFLQASGASRRHSVAHRRGEQRRGHRLALRLDHRDRDLGRRPPACCRGQYPHRSRRHRDPIGRGRGQVRPRDRHPDRRRLRAASPRRRPPHTCVDLAG